MVLFLWRVGRGKSASPVNLVDVGRKQHMINHSIQWSQKQTPNSIPSEKELSLGQIFVAVLLLVFIWALQ